MRIAFAPSLASVPSQRWYMLAKTSLTSWALGIIIEAKSELVVFSPLVLCEKSVARASRWLRGLEFWEGS
jgi:hypothetical protein